MATVSYQSSQTATVTASAASIVITKPTSLAAGDGMIAHVIVNGGTVTTPSGWTLEGTIALTGATCYLFSKVADSTDAAATNFTFAFDANRSEAAGAISRFTNINSADIVDQVGASNSSTTGTASSSNGITPTQAMGTFLILSCRRGTGTATTASGYAIATDNPTWTEAYDFFSATSTFVSLSMAYGYRANITASGTASCTINTSTNWGQRVINLAPAALPTASLASTATGITSTRTVVNATASIVSTALVPTFSAIAAVWTNLIKHTTTWTNQDRS